MQDLREAAKDAPYHLTTKKGACPLHVFWVVLLDCGLEVYQNDKDPNLVEPDPWMRLKQFCQDYDTAIVNMAFAYKLEKDPRQINLDPMADGYFYTQRLRKLWGTRSIIQYEDRSIGVGQLNGNILRIIWVLDDGQEQSETRDISVYHPKSQLFSLIRK